MICSLKRFFIEKSVDKVETKVENLVLNGKIVLDYVFCSLKFAAFTLVKSKGKTPKKAIILKRQYSYFWAFGYLEKKSYLISENLSFCFDLSLIYIGIAK